jgi:hypothetical protein
MSKFAVRKKPKIAWKSSFRIIYRTIFSPLLPTFATRFSGDVKTWRYLAAKVGMSKGGESNGSLPLRKQHARAISVA